MGKVDGLVALVTDFGRAKFDAGYYSARNDIEACRDFQSLSEKHKRELRTALTACVAEWRPISEAPMDGTKVLLYHPGYKNAFYENRDRKPRTWVDWCIDGKWYQTAPSAPPTRYQPLPPPPTETEGETK